jgi:hypothetical protein
MPASAEEEREYQRALETAGRLLGTPLALPLGDGEPAVGEELFIHLAAYAGAARAFDSYQVALAVFAEASQERDLTTGTNHGERSGSAR